MTDEQKPAGDEPKRVRKKRRKRIPGKYMKAVRGVAQGMTLQQAGEMAGYPPNSARQGAWRAMEVVRREAADVFDEEGLTLKSLAQDVDRLRHAKETKFFTLFGAVSDTREVEALHIQLKAVDMALQVQGAYKPKIASVSLNQTNNVIDFSGASEEDVDTIIRLCAAYRTGLPPGAGAQVPVEPGRMAPG